VIIAISAIPPSARDGRTTAPPAPNERTGDLAGWRRDRKAADISPQVWNRDLRAGGLTEGDLAGASLDDRSKIAGHGNKRYG
jgi:hypothetical protein